MESEGIQLGPSSSWENKESDKSSTWLICVLVKAVTDTYVIHFVPLLGSKAR